MCNEIDWSVATIEERRLFKRIMMKAVKRHSLNIDKILAENIGEDTSLENEQKKRFGRGTLARTSYAILHEWLSLKYPDFAKDFEFEFYQNKPKPKKWLEFIKQHGKFENVYLPHLNSFGIVDFTPDEPIAKRVLKRLEKFCFEVNSPMCGQTIAFQEFQNNWYILKLTKGVATLQTEIGKQYMPSHNDQPLSLQERHDMGDHSFLFFIADNDEFAKTTECLPEENMVAPERLNKFATAIGALKGEWHILRINVVFKD